MSNYKLLKGLASSSAVAAFSIVAVFAFPNSAEVLPLTGDCETIECRQDVAAARRATAAYHDINLAFADGFVQDSPCVRRAGVGTMGFHFKNAALVDQIADVTQPEILLYLPNEEGEMELVAVEYVVPNIGQAVPYLFGKAFHFSAPRNRWELHAWIWRNNPAGMFEDFNPAINCPGF